MAGRKKSRPKGFDPEVWSLLSDDVKGRKDLNRTQKSVYALLLMMSFRYTKTDGWFWHRLDDVVSELGEHGLDMTKRNLQDNVLPALLRVGLIGYRPGCNVNGRNIASYFKVFENQGVELKNDTPSHCNMPITRENTHYYSGYQTVELKNFTPSQDYPVYTPENTTYPIGNQRVEEKNFTPLEGNYIEIPENQRFMEKTSPLKEVKLKEKKEKEIERNVKERKDKETVPEGAVVLTNSSLTHAHTGDGVGEDFSFSSSNQASKPVVVDRIGLDKEHAKATLMYRAGHITIDEYSDITSDLLQSLSDDDERRSSPIMYRYDRVVEELPFTVTQDEAQKFTVRGWWFRKRGNRLLQRVRQGEFDDNVQGAWLEMKEALKWLNGLHYTHNGVILKAYSGTRDEDYQRWKRLCVNALGRTKGEKFAACIPTPNKWK